MSQMLIPNTVTEACQMLSSGNRVACAGATNLYVDREKGKYLDRDIVSLHRLKELSGIREEKDGWHIGSLKLMIIMNLVLNLKMCNGILIQYKVMICGVKVVSLKL